MKTLDEAIAHLMAVGMIPPSTRTKIYLALRQVYPGKWLS